MMLNFTHNRRKSSHAVLCVRGIELKHFQLLKKRTIAIDELIIFLFCWIGSGSFLNLDERKIRHLYLLYRPLPWVILDFRVNCAAFVYGVYFAEWSLRYKHFGYLSSDVMLWAFITRFGGKKALYSVSAELLCRVNLKIFGRRGAHASLFNSSRVLSSRALTAKSPRTQSQQSYNAV